MDGGGEGTEAGRALARLRALAGGDLSVLSSDATCDASHPFGSGRGASAAAPWRALHAALPDLERRDTILLAGPNHPDARWTAPRPARMVAALGTYVGTFRAPLAGIPPTHGVVALAYGEAHHLDADGRIAASHLVWDLAGLMIQTGCWPVAAPLGAPGHWPAPATCDGLRLGARPAGDDRDSLDRVLEMHEGLNTFRGDDVDAIDMRHWHPDFTYWAAGGIGACRGVAGFRAHHQIPYRRAFPGAVGAGHFVRLSDGPYAVTGGDVALTHSGADYMGVGASGRALRFRVMDFYRFGPDGRIAENWLPNDTLGLLHQMGVDVLARVAHHAGAPRRTL